MYIAWITPSTTTTIKPKGIINQLSFIKFNQQKSSTNELIDSLRYFLRGRTSLNDKTRHNLKKESFSWGNVN